MLKRLVPLVIIVMIVSLAAVACGGDGDSDPAATPGRSSPSPVPAAPTATADSSGSTAASPAAQPGGMTVEVLNRDNAGSGKYAFEPADFNFKVGDTVTFVMTAETEYHTFTVDDLGIDEAVNGGETVEFTVTFDKAGEFKLFCIPHEALGMVGTVTVE